MLFSACEGGTDAHKEFINNTNSDLQLIIYRNDAIMTTDAVDTILVSANQHTDYYVGGGDRQFFDYPDCLTEIDSIQVTVADGKTLIKNLMDVENWSKETSGNRSILHNCIIEINPEDIQ